MILATKASKKGSTFLKYKGKPLVRNGRTLYYGNMYDKYVIMMQIVNMEKVKGEEVAGKVQVQLLSTEANVQVKDRVIKGIEKNGLYNAIDIGSIWLERALKAE